MFLVLKILALIALSSRPCEYPMAVHLVLAPKTSVLSAVLVGHDTLALLLALPEMPDVLVSVAVEELPLAAFLIKLVAALKPCPIRPRLLTLRVLLIVPPVPLVLPPAQRYVLTVPVCLVVLPVAAVVVTVRMV